MKLIHVLSESQVQQLWHLYQNEWWSKERTLEDTKEMVAHSTLVFGLVDEQNKLAAFCRVLTDFVFRGTIYDVIVAENHRDQGLGSELLDSVTTHPRLQRVSTLWLCCKPELVPFYKRWGFEVFDEGQLWMIKPQREG